MQGSWVIGLGDSTMNVGRKVWLAVLVLCISARLFAADPVSIARQARAWRVEHDKEILKEFCDLLAIPDVASDTHNIQRNARMIRGMLEKRGLRAQVLTSGDAPPIVVGDLVASPSPPPPLPE